MLEQIRLLFLSSFYLDGPVCTKPVYPNVDFKAHVFIVFQFGCISRLRPIRNILFFSSSLFVFLFYLPQEYPCFSKLKFAHKIFRKLSAVDDEQNMCNAWARLWQKPNKHEDEVCVSVTVWGVEDGMERGATWNRTNTKTHETSTVTTYKLHLIFFSCWYWAGIILQDCFK